MDVSVESVLAIAAGIGLAAASGLRVFVPLLAAGLAARFGGLPLTEGFNWLSTNGALIALSTASVLEVLAYTIPGLDHVLDLVAGPATLAAGVIVSAAVMVDVPPAIMWPAAIVGGGGVAALTKITAAALRAKTGILTAGLANPIVSTAETFGAAGIAVVAIAIPVVCLLGIVLAVTLVWRRAGSRRHM